MRATKEYRLSLTEEAKEILNRLSLEQKVDLMSANFYMDMLQELLESLGGTDTHYNITPYPAGGIDGVIPPVQFCDGPRGVVCGIGKTTCFPVSMARGATFDPELEEAIGHAIGREVRAFGGNLFAGVSTIRAGDAVRKPTVKSHLLSAGWARRWCAAYRMKMSWPA